MHECMNSSGSESASICFVRSNASRSQPTREIVADGERKSVGPIAARATGDPLTCKPMHDRLLHFIGRSPWSDRLVRRGPRGTRFEALQEQEPVSTWIVDDTGFL